MVQWIPVLVALVCLISPSISRSWRPHDQYDVDHNHKPNHSWEHDDHSPDFDSSEEDSWERDDDFGDHQAYGHGHGGYPHNHENHAFDHQHSHDYHHNHHGHHHHGHGQGHGRDDKKQENHGHSSKSAGPSDSASDNQGKTNENEEKLQQPTKNVESPAQEDLSQNNQNEKQVPKDDADGLLLAERQARSTSTSSLSPPTASSSTTSAPVTAPAPAAEPSLPSLLDVVVCVRSCPSTSEYNPVCGSNNFTYNNPGALECAMNCGANVTLSRRAPCARLVVEQASTGSSDPEVTEASAPDTVTTEAPTTQPPTEAAPVTSTPTRSTDITAEDLDKIMSIFKP